MIYAVKYPGSSHWRIARKVKASEYSQTTIVPSGWDVWSEDGTTAWIGTVGNGEQVVKLETAQEIERLRAGLQNIVDSYDARSELFTCDADCAANLADHARHAIKETKSDG